MKIVQQLNQDLWQDFVDSHPQSQIFHTPEMFQVFACTKAHKPTLWAAVNDQQYPLALLLPVEVTLMNGVLRSVTSRAVTYGSVLCAPGPEGQQALKQVLLAYKKAVGRKRLFTELRNLSDMGELQAILNNNGFIYEDHLNFLVDLARPEDEIWAAIRSNAKRNIRRARKMNVIIEDVEDPRRIPEIYAVLEAVYQRLQVPLADISFFREAFETLHPHGMLKILAARVNHTDIGVLTLLMFKGVITYWYTGTLREYSAYRAADFLVWRTLEWGQQNGFQVLDFGGAGKPDEEYGVRDFKAKFGGELVNYGRNVCVHAPITFKMSKFIYQTARPLLYGQDKS